jgi:hypothetical protein
MSDEVRQYLDTLDFSDELTHGRAVKDVMDVLDAIYGDGYDGPGWLFQDVTEDDFAEYIRNIYGVRCYEVSMLYIK